MAHQAADFDPFIATGVEAPLKVLVNELVTESFIPPTNVERIVLNCAYLLRLATAGQGHMVHIGDKDELKDAIELPTKKSTHLSIFQSWVDVLYPVYLMSLDGYRFKRHASGSTMFSKKERQTDPRAAALIFKCYKLLCADPSCTFLLQLSCVAKTQLEVNKKSNLNHTCVPFVVCQKKDELASLRFTPGFHATLERALTLSFPQLNAKQVAADMMLVAEKSARDVECQVLPVSRGVVEAPYVPHYHEHDEAKFFGCKNCSRHCPFQSDVFFISQVRMQPPSYTVAGEVYDAMLRAIALADLPIHLFRSDFLQQALVPDFGDDEIKPITLLSLAAAHTSAKDVAQDKKEEAVLQVFLQRGLIFLPIFTLSPLNGQLHVSLLVIHNPGAGSPARVFLFDASGLPVDEATEIWREFVSHVARSRKTVLAATRAAFADLFKPDLVSFQALITINLQIVVELSQACHLWVFWLQRHIVHQVGASRGTSLEPCVHNAATAAVSKYRQLKEWKRNVNTVEWDGWFVKFRVQAGVQQRFSATCYDRSKVHERVYAQPKAPSVGAPMKKLKSK